MNKRATASLIFAAVLVVAIAGVWVALSEATVTGNVPRAPSKLPSSRCTSNVQCSDGNDCTKDSCTPNGCVYVPKGDCMPCSTGFCMGAKCVSMLDASCSTPSPSPSPYPWETPSPSPSPYPWETPSPSPTSEPTQSPFPTPDYSPYPTPDYSPSPSPTPPPSCEHMRHITAISGWVMRHCQMRYIPQTGEYQFALTFGF